MIERTIFSVIRCCAALFAGVIGKVSAASMCAILQRNSHRSRVLATAFHVVCAPITVTALWFSNGFDWICIQT